MLLQASGIQKYFGAELCLADISFSVNEQDRIGIIGQNGAGKTTLLKLITGEYEPDAGELSFARGVRVGYLEQNAALHPQRTVYQEMQDAFAPVLAAMQELQQVQAQMAQRAAPALAQRHSELQAVIDAADGYQIDTRIKKILNGMAFPQAEWEKRVGVLSGGEHTRLRLAKLLLQSPDILILDEPTNHLDFVTMEWLEGYLKTYSGAVLVVSHDRYFLDEVCTRIFEVEDHTLTAYKGNYSAYLPQRQAADALRQKQHDADVEKAKKLDVSFAKEALKEMGPMRAKEKWTLFCFVLTVLLWATGDLTGMNANIVPMLTVVLVLIPPFVDKKAGDILRRIPWASMVWMGLVLGMSTLVENGGGFQWLADKLILNSAFISNMSFTVFLAFWIVLVVFIHIVFAGMNAMVAIFVPIGMAIAEALGFDAYTVGIITTMCVAVGANFFCFNSQSNVLFYAMERFTVKQQFLSAVVINFIACVCLLLTLLLFWPAIGLV